MAFRWQKTCGPAFLAVSCALAPVLAQAGAYSVVPVRVAFAPRDRAVAVTLTNQGDAPIILNAELFKWEQRPDGSDLLTPTDDVVLAPPLVRLSARGQQVVRLALLRAPDPQTQLTYRMIVREQPDPNAAPASSVAIPVTLAMSLPVFVTPPGGRWEVECSRAAAEVRCVNSGNATALVRSARVEQNGAVVARFEGGAYLLPGVTRPLPLEPQAAPQGPGKLVVVFDDDQTADFELR